MNTNRSVDELTQGGTAALNSGHTKAALELFLQAEEYCLEPSATVEQLAGICLRMLKRYTDADSYFCAALEHAESDTHKGRIVRDWAMVPFEQRDYARATTYLEDSLDFLQPRDEDKAEEAGERHIEYYVTIGFLARVYGKQGDIQRARDHHRNADEHLRGIAPYELNNLVWQLKVERFPERYSLVRRAWRLARQAKHKKRQREIILLAISRRLGK